MAQTISIGSTRLVDLLKAKLGRELRLLKDGGFQVDLEESPRSIYFLAFRVTDNGASGIHWRKRRISLNISWPTASRYYFKSLGKYFAERYHQRKLLLFR